MSIRGALSFLFAGFIGRLSDSYGRKYFLLMHIIISMLPIIPLIFWYNIWPYLVLTILFGFNGSNNSATPIMAAYVTDSVNSHQKTVAYGLIYTMAGIGLFFGSFAAILVSVLLGQYYNVYVLCVFYFIQIIYAICIVPESLKLLSRKLFINESFNPFRPLLHVKDNLIVFWVSIIQFIISLPETGVLDTVLPYVLDQLS